MYEGIDQMSDDHPSTQLVPNNYECLTNSFIFWLFAKMLLTQMDWMPLTSLGATDRNTDKQGFIKAQHLFMTDSHDLWFI